MQLDLTQSSVKEIASFYSPNPSTYLRANMVISSDDHFIDEFGSPKQFSSALDLKVLLTLRAISDCVLVGGNTVRSDNYRPPVLAGEYKALSDQAAKLVIVTRSLDFDLSTRLFSEQDNQPIFLTEKSESESWRLNHTQLSQRAEVVVFSSPLDLVEVIAHLRHRDLTNIVCEGGPILLSQLISLGLIDELDVTHSPIKRGFAAPLNQVHLAMQSWPVIATAKLGEHELRRYIR